VREDATKKGQRYVLEGRLAIHDHRRGANSHEGTAAHKAKRTHPFGTLPQPCERGTSHDRRVGEQQRQGYEDHAEDGQRSSPSHHETEYRTKRHRARLRQRLSGDQRVDHHCAANGSVAHVPAYLEGTGTPGGGRTAENTPHAITPP
jgi:hypothetical protein